MPACFSAGGTRHGISRAWMSYHFKSASGSGGLVSRKLYDPAIVDCRASKLGARYTLRVIARGSMVNKTTYRGTKGSQRRGRGFAAMSGLIKTPIKAAGEKRGFAVMRLLTHWAEIVGPDMAKIATPVKVGYARDGFGATLTVLATGANAPMLQMQLPQIREKVNACYGYSAISRVVITQTAPVGFHEGQARFDHGDRPARPPVTEAVKEVSAELAADVEDDGLRTALDQLAQNVLSRERASKRN